MAGGGTLECGSVERGVVRSFALAAASVVTAVFGVVTAEAVTAEVLLPDDLKAVVGLANLVAGHGNVVGAVAVETVLAGPPVWWTGIRSGNCGRPWCSSSVMSRFGTWNCCRSSFAASRWRSASSVA
jgi:hypothetical protein